MEIDPPKPKEVVKKSPVPEPTISAAISKVWSGKLVFPEASTFKANAYVISGNVTHSDLRKSIPKSMNVAGRLAFDTVGEVSFNIALHFHN